MKKLQGAAIVAMLVLLFACGERRIEGTYYNVANGTEFIELKPDGLFHLKAGEMEMNGKYVVDGKSIVLDPGKGMVARGTIEKGLIIDNDGTKWQRK